MGQASEIEEAEIIDWVEQSEENLNQFHFQRSLWDTMLLNEDFVKDIQTSDEKPAIIRRLNAYKYYWVAASIIALIVSTAYLFFYSTVFSKEELVSVEVPVGKTKKVILEDGTVIWLNAKSKLHFPKHFDDNKREVNLDGEAFFEVKHNPSKPFYVVTESQTIRVLGTVFDVDAYSNKNYFNTTLVSGSVQVKSDKKESLENETILKPGEKLSFNKLEKRYEKKAVNVAGINDWEKGIYNFNSISFGEVINKLSNNSSLNIVLKDTALQNLICNGKFLITESAEDILNVMKVSMPFTYKVDKLKNEITIFYLEK